MNGNSEKDPTAAADVPADVSADHTITRQFDCADTVPGLADPLDSQRAAAVLRGAFADLIEVDITFPGQS